MAIRVKDATVLSQSLRRFFLLWFLGSALTSVVVYLALLPMGGLLSDPWTPLSLMEFVRGFLGTIFYLSVGLSLIPLSTLVEDIEVRLHVRYGYGLVNPLCLFVSMVGVFCTGVSIVFVCRYLYLLVIP
ncbi:hypothetical protein EPO44_10650 [bacterium]|nr:MAG: hypothetical protein EPO44_10650 [bacterium]